MRACDGQVNGEELQSVIDVVQQERVPFLALSGCQSVSDYDVRVLAEADDRVVVVATSDVLVRSADAADLFTVGVSSGACSVKRLQQAGARVVYRELAELAASLKGGGGDLVRAGMLPIV